MTLEFFVKVLTLTDKFQPMAQGVGAGKIVWIRLKARTNNFLIASNDNALDGVLIQPTTTAPTIPSIQIGQTFSLDKLYWKNAVTSTNAIVEIIGMREV